ncbi:SDR family oxidoreductase [Pedobacter sp. N23S346]|uniref:SDR family oxidoreductase n=1 Tax=Pedobacter sp. N23S346 TaxID=3402750 RepID=UPI003AD6A2E8
MILVTGATGNYGKATIDFLLKKGISANSISALVRDVEKAEDLKTKGITLKIGDYDNYTALVEAFKGVDKLLLVSSSDVVKRGQQHENAVKAAIEAGVKHILYTSFERKNDTETSPISFVAKSHIDTENLIKASGLTYTIFRNNLYLDALPMFFGEQVLTSGIFLPAGDTKSAFALRNDMAEATANVLTSEGHENKEYSMSNTENISIQEMAQDLSEIVGRQINYVSPPKDIYMETLTGAGVPTEYVGMFAGFAEAIKQGEFSTEKTDLENLLGRKPMTAKAFLKEVYTSN